MLQQPSRTNIPSMDICSSEWKYEKCMPKLDRQIGREERKKEGNVEKEQVCSWPRLFNQRMSDIVVLRC